MEDSAILNVSMSDVIDGSVKTTFTSRVACCRFQTHSCLLGTRDSPLKNLKKVGDVKRYLNSISVAKDGVLIVRDSQPSNYHASASLCLVLSSMAS